MGMVLRILFFITSFLGDSFAYIFYERYLDSAKKNTAFLIWAILSAVICWVFVFKLQEHGDSLRLFLPFWAAGAAIGGYFIGGIAIKTPVKDLLSMPALLAIGIIAIGMYMLQWSISGK
jgi:hypothetical protein